MSTPLATQTIADHLAAPLRVGEPDVVGALAVFPVFGPPARIEYRSFARGAALGVIVKERPGQASVNDLVVSNPTATPVLLYEGEEVLGAQQNRTFDVSALVGAGASVSVPVSCVEAGRWDRARHDDAFTPAPQAAYPSLRRLKHERVTARADAGVEARAAQGAVWSEVAAKSARLAVRSPTAALHDVYEHHRSDLRAYESAVRLRDGQTGAIAAIGGRIAVLDHVSRPDVFADLFGPLVHGYALDAIEAETAAPGVRALPDADAFVRRLQATPVSERDGIGLGREVRLAGAGVRGAALVKDDELVQLTAFPAGGPPPPRRDARSARIMRPSRRRGA